MTPEDLYKSLDYVNHSREKRQEMATLVMQNQKLIGLLLKIAEDVKNPISSKACWVIEFAAKKKLNIIFPYLNEFTKLQPKLVLDSSIRPIAKINEFLINAYFSKTANEAQNHLNEIHLERITSAAFDWLISDVKVATKAYSMSCLFLLSKKYNWISPELRLVLEQNYASGSAAYKARARMVLAKLK